MWLVRQGIGVNGDMPFLPFPMSKNPARGTDNGLSQAKDLAESTIISGIRGKSQAGPYQFTRLARGLHAGAPLPRNS